MDGTKYPESQQRILSYLSMAVNEMKRQNNMEYGVLQEISFYKNQIETILNNNYGIQEDFDYSDDFGSFEDDLEVGMGDFSST